MNIDRVEFSACYPDIKPVSFSAGCFVAAIIRSTAKIELNGKEYSFKPNTVIVYGEDTPKKITGENCDLLIDAFEFKCSDAVSMLEAHDIPLDTPLCGYDTYHLSMIVYNMKLENLNCDSFFDKMQTFYASQFFISLARLIKKGIHPYPHRLDGLRSSIINMPYKNWNIEDMVNISGMSRRQFYNSYFNAFGNTPQQEIIISRMEYAKMLLDSTEYRIGEIAAMCNYKSTEHFLRIFKQKIGITPNQYRKRINRKKFVNFVKNSPF